eukprot:213094-Amphidinium_carterae.1
MSTTSHIYLTGTGADTVYKERSNHNSINEDYEAKHYSDRLRLPQERQRQALRYGTYYVRVYHRTWLHYSSTLQRSQHRSSESISTVHLGERTTEHDTTVRW